MLGHQQYALEIGGNSYTLDWLAPEALPLFMGVNAYETMQQNGEFNMADLIGVLTRIGEPMMQMSFLQSLMQSNMRPTAIWRKVLRHWRMRPQAI